MKKLGNTIHPIHEQAAVLIGLLKTKLKSLAVRQKHPHTGAGPDVVLFFFQSNKEFLEQSCPLLLFCCTLIVVNATDKNSPS